MNGLILEYNHYNYRTYFSWRWARYTSYSWSSGFESRPKYRPFQSKIFAVLPGNYWDNAWTPSSAPLCTICLNTKSYAFLQQNAFICSWYLQLTAYFTQTTLPGRSVQWRLTCYLYSRNWTSLLFWKTSSSSVPSQSMWDLRWKKLQWKGFCSENFGFPLSLSLVVSEGQAGEARETSTKQFPFENPGSLDRKVLSRFLVNESTSVYFQTVYNSCSHIIIFPLTL